MQYYFHAEFLEKYGMYNVLQIKRLSNSYVYIHSSYKYKVAFHFPRDPHTKQKNCPEGTSVSLLRIHAASSFAALYMPATCIALPTLHCCILKSKLLSQLLCKAGDSAYSIAICTVGPYSASRHP